MCGGDIRSYRNGADYENKLLGHEVTGVVVEADPQSGYSQGQKLALAPDVHCDRCPSCRRGLYNLCDNLQILGQHIPGGFAEYLALTQEVLERGIVNELPPELSFVQGTLAEPLSSVLACQDRMGLGAGASIVVFGGGPIGLLHTAEVLSTAFSDLKLNPEMLQGGYPCYHHVVPGRHLTIALNQSGGLAPRWLRDRFCEMVIAEARMKGEDSYALMLRCLEEKPSGLLFLPHLVGGGTPEHLTGARGALVGLTYETDRSRVAQAVLEGLTFDLRLNLECLREAGINVQEIRAAGGGARSPYWLQLKADVTGQKIAVLANNEAACLEAAMLAGKAVGIYCDLASAVSRCVQTPRVYEPRQERRALHGEYYDLYRQTVGALRSIHRRLRDLQSHTQ